MVGTGLFHWLPTSNLDIYNQKKKLNQKQKKICLFIQFTGFYLKIFFSPPLSPKVSKSIFPFLWRFKNKTFVKFYNDNIVVCWVIKVINLI